MRELQQIANQIKHGTLVRKDVAVTSQTLKKEGEVFLRTVETLAKREKAEFVTLIGIIRG